MHNTFVSHNFLNGPFLYVAVETLFTFARKPSMVRADLSESSNVRAIFCSVAWVRVRFFLSLVIFIATDLRVFFDNLFPKIACVGFHPKPYNNLMYCLIRLLSHLSKCVSLIWDIRFGLELVVFVWLRYFSGIVSHPGVLRRLSRVLISDSS